MDKEKKIKAIEKEMFNLKESPLYSYRQENGYVPVVGGGSLDAKIMFVGEAPGRKEAEVGKPFIGSAGKILDNLLESVDIKREEVYITSIVNDRPPKNRDPRPEEIELYAPFLDRQIEVIKPEVIATLGRFSMEYIMKRYGLEGQIDTITQLHGQVFETTMPWGDRVKIVPLYHPAASIYNQKLKDILKKDFRVLRAVIDF